jgi:fructoselysine-6-P-deglycase FrlB-like protein
VALTVWATRQAAARLPVPADVIIDAQAITAPIAFITLGQCFAHALSLARGHDPDISRGVSKVTITR